MDNDHHETVAFRGLNFEGTMRLAEDSLKIDLIELRKGGVYELKLNDEILAREFKRYLFFKSTQKLFAELREN